MQLVNATIQLYNAIRSELLPTPNKSHYCFNLRDMGKVVQGLMRADPKALDTQQQVREVWHTHTAHTQWPGANWPCKLA